MSILHVSEFHTRACIENAHNVACPDLGKTFILKTRNANLGTIIQTFLHLGVFLGENPLLHVPKTDMLVFKLNESLFLGHGAADMRFV